jgi:hypothetical protein
MAESTIKRRQWLSLILLLFIIHSCHDVPELDKDAMTLRLCNAFEKQSINGASVDMIADVFNKHLDPYKASISEDSADRLTEFFYFRLQRDCDKFLRIADALDKSEKGDWMQLDYEPPSRITEAEFNEFFKKKNLRYLENNGDTVQIIVTDSTWEDRFIDGTYSKLSLVKQTGGEFKIRFIESNNDSRKYMSKPGDMYRYKLVAKKDGFYEVFVQPEGSEVKNVFRIYY